MRDFVKVSQTVWKSKKFRALPNDDGRYLYLYILTCPHSNSPGCFDLPMSYASGDLRWENDRIKAALDSLCEAALIRFDSEENTVLIENWFEFNSPANPKHAVGMLSQLKQASSDELRLACGKAVEAEIKRKKFDREAFVRGALAAFFEPFGNGIATETRRDGEGDQTQTETRPRLDETETREEPRPALRAVVAEGPDALATVAVSTPRPLNPSLLEAAKRIGAIA